MNLHYLQLSGDSVSVGGGEKKASVRLSDFSGLYQQFSDYISGGSTHRLEKHGAKVMSGAFRTDGEIDEFVYAVVEWGGGWRVYGSLPRRNGGAAAAKKNVARAVRNAVGHLQSSEIASAIGELRAVKGLGMSYASKILRMLAPDKAVTFDSWLEYAFGGRLGNDGYQKWCGDCAEVARVLERKKIKNTARANGKWKAADIEAVIFAEVRRIGRSASTSAKR